MKRVLFVRPPAAEGPWQWLSAPADGTAAVVRSGGIEALPAHAADLVVALLDGEHVLTTVQRVPGAASKLARKAIPYALEDQLLLPPEDLLFEIRPLGGEAYAVAMAARDRVARIVDVLTAQAARRVVVVPDYLCLPWTPQEWTIAASEDRAWVRLDATQGFRAARADLPLLLSHAIAERDAPARVRFLDLSEHGLEPPALAELEFTVQHLPGPPLALFAHHFEEAAAFDVAAGLRRAQEQGRGARSWIAAAAVLLVVAVLHAAALYQRGRALEQRVRTMEAATVARFRQLLPDSGRIEDPRAQADQALAQRRATAGAAAGFLDLFERAAQSVAAHDDPALEFMAVSYVPGALEITLAASTMASVEAFRRRMDEGAIAAQTISTEATRGGIVGVLRVAERLP